MVVAGIHVRAAKLGYLDSTPFGIDHPEFSGAGREGHDTLTVHLGRSVGWREHLNDQRGSVDGTLVRRERVPDSLRNISDVREPLL